MSYAPPRAEVIARYTQDYYAGTPAITCNRAGNGYAVYVATFGDTALYTALADWLLKLAAVQPGLPTPAGVEVSTRWQDNRPLRFVINHNETPSDVQLEGAYTDLISGAPLGKTLVTLAPHQVLILVPAAR